MREAIVGIAGIAPGADAATSRNCMEQFLEGHGYPNALLISQTASVCIPRRRPEVVR